MRSRVKNSACYIISAGRVFKIVCKIYCSRPLTVSSCFVSLSCRLLVVVGVVVPVEMVNMIQVEKPIVCLSNSELAYFVFLLLLFHS